jgi:peptidoglycan/xylan/chitin deacetylase (PgdA/CDA1 family)
MFHHFHGMDYHQGQGSISAAEFEQVIKGLNPETIVPARSFLDLAINGKLQGNEICITFDDSLRCQFDVALPVLEKYGITAFWFVNTGFLDGTINPLESYRYFRLVEFDSVDEFYDEFFGRLEDPKYLHSFDEAAMSSFINEMSIQSPFYSKNDLRFRFIRDRVLGPEEYSCMMKEIMDDHNFDPHELSRKLWMDELCIRHLHNSCHVIGLHSHRHPTYMASLPESEQRAEYEKNQANLSAMLGEDPLSMSHPCNSYNETTLKILDDLGVRLGFRANMLGGDVSLLEYPRMDHAILRLKP